MNSAIALGSFRRAFEDEIDRGDLSALVVFDSGVSRHVRTRASHEKKSQKATNKHTSTNRF